MNFETAKQALQGFMLNMKSLVSKEASRELLLSSSIKKKDQIEEKLQKLPSLMCQAGLDVDAQLEQDIVDVKKKAAQRKIELVQEWKQQQAYLEKELALAELEIEGVK